MKWYVSKEIDSADEVIERRQFYAELTGHKLSIEDSDASWFLMSDGRNDNRCMIIGHTNTVYEVMALLRKTRGRHKYYVCSCAMALRELKAKTTLIDRESLVFLAKQDLIIVREISVVYKNVSVCKFIDKADTGFGFKAAQSELNMFHSNFKGFHNKLDQCFARI